MAALPQTGDHSRPILWVVLLLMSAAGLVYCGRKSRA
ncbi:MAG: LPXTG cell wall anchor domain-containing protein [Clostridia bacterium]|nr:LPXTG cell wall anchor domain-containing protein [Clostridia bacterium]